MIADYKWSNNVIFPLNNSLDGSEEIVGLKNGLNFKTNSGAGLVGLVNTTAQLLSSSQITGLDTQLNNKLSIA